jgi:hypothetical protein
MMYLAALAFFVYFTIRYVRAALGVA